MQECFVMATLWKPRHWAVPFSLVVLLLCAGQAPLPEPVTDQETELGQAVYNQLRDKGEIIESSPLYDSLRPIAEAISRVAQPRYNHPFKFFLVHETTQTHSLRPVETSMSSIHCSIL